MRTLFLVGILFAGVVPGRAAEPLDQAFQSALVAEEVRRDLNAAVRGYEAVIAQVDAQRAIAATAVFRLAECFRKLGRNDEAAAQYQRVLRDFPAEATLVRLSRENLLALGVAPPAEGETAPPRRQDILLDLHSEEAEIARLRTLFDRSPDLLNAEKGGKTPLMEAAEKGQLAVVQALLNWGVEVNRIASSGTALSVAAANGHKAVVEALLDAKADPNLVMQSGHTALGGAVGQGFTAVVETLLARGAKVEVEGAYPPLLAAVSDSKTALIERLVKAGADVNAVVNRGVPVAPKGGGGGNTVIRTVLEAAVLWGEREAGRTLVRLGAKADIGTLGRSLSSGGMPKVASEWLDELLAAAPPEGFPTEGLNALMGKCMDHAQQFIPALLRAGGSADAVNSGGFPLLVRAAAGGPTEALEALLAAKPDVNVALPDGTTALHAAAAKGDTNSVSLLLKAGADPNRLDQRQLTPLEVVRMAISRGLAPPSPRPVAPRDGPTRIVPVRVRDGSEVPANVSEAAMVWQRIEAMLLAAGAQEDLARRQAIHWRIGGQTEPFHHRVGVNPPPTLAQFLILALQAPRAEWVDLQQIRVRRLTADGQQESAHPIGADWWRMGECRWSHPLEWGDVVELPELDRVVGSSAPGLSEETAAALRRCGVQQVSLTIQGETTELHLYPAPLPSARRGGALTAPGLPANVPPAGAVISSCNLRQVLDLSGRLRVSSDLTRVQVTRKSSGQKWTLDVVNDPEAREYWLVDGDQIEVPEKEDAP
ncbi:MAG: ankyrin repeat domain-containing protein [Verrucomicrobiae bacterium]|nr:ankyrin repeat domain-containing protein [Verrucomicrobiae bacterium]